MTFDAVVIGAGPSGLAAAARMACFGAKVCLLEAHGRPGGLNSWYRLNGREISAGLHALTNFSPSGRTGPLGKLRRQLRLDSSLFPLRPQIRSRVRFPSAELSFTNEPEFFRSRVAAVFPREIDGFDRFRGLVLAADEGELTSRQSSARDIMEACLRDPLLIDMLACPVMFYGNPGGVGDGGDGQRTRPDMDWLLFCVIWKCIFESGLSSPASGMRPLWEELLKRVPAAGGEVRLGARVERLVSAGDRVAAARLASGEEVAGNVFFSSAGAVETSALLGEAPDRPAGRVSVAEGLALTGVSARETGLADTVVFYSFSDRFAYRRPESLTEPENGVVCAGGNYAPLPAARAGPGEAPGCLKVTQLASYPAWKRLGAAAYAEAKRKTAAGMGEALSRLGVRLPAGGEPEKRFPPFDDLFTPVTLERYARHAEAALYGSPVKTRGGIAFRANLVLIGTDQGFPGIVGAMLSGVAMANLHFLGRRRDAGNPFGIG